ncbi:MAG: acyl carrier protein [Actinobacteria bacterium]|nr:acyl carrier protein [Actinomycetota bacterium]
MKKLSEVKLQVISILSEIRPEYDFSQDLNFIEEGMLDSLDIVTLVTGLDEKFSISIDGKDITPENFSSLELIANLLKKKGVRI